MPHLRCNRTIARFGTNRCIQCILAARIRKACRKTISLDLGTTSFVKCQSLDKGFGSAARWSLSPLHRSISIFRAGRRGTTIVPCPRDDQFELNLFLFMPFFRSLLASLQQSLSRERVIPSRVNLDDRVNWNNSPGPGAGLLRPGKVRVNRQSSCQFEMPISRDARWSQHSL